VRKTTEICKILLLSGTEALGLIQAKDPQKLSKFPFSSQEIHLSRVDAAKFLSRILRKA
jgi:hypothetical protein